MWKECLKHETLRNKKIQSFANIGGNMVLKNCVWVWRYVAALKTIILSKIILCLGLKSINYFVSGFEDIQ